MATFVAGALGGVDPADHGCWTCSFYKESSCKDRSYRLMTLMSYEANEAFAAQSVAVGKDLNFDLSTT